MVSRWLENTLKLDDIESTNFRARSTHSGVTSAAKAMNMFTDTIMKSTGTSQESTSAKYYRMPELVTQIFGDTLLRHCCYC